MIFPVKFEGLWSITVDKVQRGAAPALPISPKKGSFLRPPHVRDFVKEGYFLVPRYEV